MKKTFDNTEKCALIEEKMSEIFEILGLDLEDVALKESPKRIAQMYVHEVFDSLDEASFPKITLDRQKGASEQVISIKKIQVTSFCAHHFVPMVGFAQISYLPADDQIIGLSQIHSIVRYYAHRPQLQERLTLDIANGLMKALGTEDISVTLQLRHFCVIARGVEDISSETETVIMRGRFSKN